jgi:hypothetical protein
MQTIEQTLAGLEIGAPQVHANLEVYPLTSADALAAGSYLLLDEALAKKLARITEVSESGSVPELAFENGSAEKILLVDGDELIGARQNRIVNITILVGAGKKLVIPVSCVEQGRWAWKSRHFDSMDRVIFAKARAGKMRSVSASMRERGNRRSDQSEVWAAVHSKAQAIDCRSDTMSMSDLYEGRAREIGAYASALKAAPGQRGAVFAVDGKVTGVELFDSPGPFARCFAKIVRSYAMDAIESEKGAVAAAARADVKAFLEAMAKAAAENFPALGEGEDVRLSGEGITGGALVVDGRVVHLAGFRVA